MASRQLTSLSMSLLAATLVSSTALGQVLNLNPNQDGVRRDPAHDLDNDEINRADCDRDEVIRFNVGIMGVLDTLDFQVWRGTGCADGDTRFDDTSNCAQLDVMETRNDNSLDVDISVRQIMAARKEGGGSGGTGGTGGSGGTSGASGNGGTGGIDNTTAGTGATGAFGGFGGIDQSAQAPTGEAGTATTGSVSADVCDGDPSFPEPTEFALHFILVDGNGDQPSGDYTPALWNARYDLIGPAKPRDVSAGIGENTLVLRWAIEDDRGDIDHYVAYCAPPPGSAVVGAGGEGPIDPDECPSDLVGAERPPDEYFCGESDGYSASMQTVPLENNVYYSVAIAGVDHFKNPGDLSDVDCEAPQLVRDFYEAYRLAGGQGGGGFCSISGERSYGFFAFVALGAVALYARRRAVRVGKGAS